MLLGISCRLCWPVSSERVDSSSLCFMRINATRIRPVISHAASPGCPVCFGRLGSLGQERQPPAGPVKQETPLGESQRPDGEMDIRSIDQKRIGKDEFRATGEVEVHYQDMLLKADEVWGNRLTQDVEGQGHVYFEQGQQKIWGERFKLNLRTKMGSFYQVKGRADPGFIFEAEEVEKIGEDKYRVKDGFVTACEDRIPKWSFSVKDAVFRIDQQVHLKHPIFRIKKIPLFYSPYLYAPTN